MQKYLFQRGKILVKDGRNKLEFFLFKLIQPVYRRVFKSDVAFLYCDHPVITAFLIRLKARMNITIHFLQPHEDFSAYRKVIVPNGQWPIVKAASDRIPDHKKVYCEVGFFPQNRNLYFDDKGVHGHSSLRDITLPRLEPSERAELEDFKGYYTSQNYIRLRWDTVSDNTQNDSAKQASSTYQKPFIFVPLQLESDTAFDLCPFDSNQQVIETIERYLPNKRIIFKVHPWDRSPMYRVSEGNVILPSSNKDLQQLLVQSEAVVSCNSTVMLEALIYGKKCASLGIGFTTNHNVSLECHLDPDKLTRLDSWEPGQEAVDSFLFKLLQKQINIEFWKSAKERDKLLHWLKLYDVIP